MNYQMEIINIIQGVTDNRVLAFLYGMIDELTKHAEDVIRSEEEVTP